MISRIRSTPRASFVTFILPLLIIILNEYTPTVAGLAVIGSGNNGTLLTSSIPFPENRDFALVLIKSGGSLSPTTLYRMFVAALAVATKNDFEAPTHGISAPGRDITVTIVSDDAPPLTPRMQWRHVVWAMAGWAQIMTEDSDFREAQLRIFWKNHNIGQMIVTSTEGRQLLPLLPKNDGNAASNNNTVGDPVKVASNSSAVNENLHFSFAFIEGVPALKVHHTFMTIIKAMAALAFYDVRKRLRGFDFELPKRYDCSITFANADQDPRHPPVLRVNYSLDALVSISDFMIVKERFQPLQGKLSLGDELVGYVTVAHSTQGPPGVPDQGLAIT